MLVSIFLVPNMPLFATVGPCVNIEKGKNFTSGQNNFSQ